MRAIRASEHKRALDHICGPNSESDSGHSKQHGSRGCEAITTAEKKKKITENNSCSTNAFDCIKELGKVSVAGSEFWLQQS